MKKYIFTLLSVEILLHLIAGFLIVYYSNWGVYVGAFILVWANNIAQSNKDKFK